VKEIEGNHQGENLAPLVMEVIKDWEIAEKLGYFVMDNASNNDTMMRWISKGKLANSVYFDSILLKTLEMLHEYGIQYDSQHHRLRCQGHVLNLSVNSFLYVTDSDYLEEDDDVPGQLKQSLKDIKKWRKFGPIGKLHNIVVDIQSSAIRMQEFLILSRGTRPVRDNKTRWNSMEAMIKRSINRGSPHCTSTPSGNATPPLPLVVGFFRLSDFLSCPLPGCLGSSASRVSLQRVRHNIASSKYI
jgi:hypothetical protein